VFHYNIVTLYIAKYNKIGIVGKLVIV